MGCFVSSKREEPEEVSRSQGNTDPIIGDILKISQNGGIVVNENTIKDSTFDADTETGTSFSYLPNRKDSSINSTSEAYVVKPSSNNPDFGKYIYFVET